MRRTKEQSKQMDQNIIDLFKSHPDARLVQNRYRALKALLKKKYTFGEMTDSQIEAMAFDCVSYDRKLRLFTEGEEVELKQELLEQYIVDELL